ncbi:uncharacterized protein SPPG_08934 [Spizellomyces punctatus DAOM BR117]|uniref:Midasin n=1 Tax=Spizellomyces punctatus (strain DAOM BR117) TaxID=645134 RepID=A0A0L0HSS7_SPIPD|nr:uncharacterized protein SPPG_08934 [Spizellomyces punctatus DAOM BR117]KND03960.1 hypothetical protein SPPG_08934 [Spizellomyces punctatus DAOM BR117]|eukprot:XP_016611999.1 hypothetical protein SPPG_08934 [Spizellomyces punctatus DAOM BR117]
MGTAMFDTSGATAKPTGPDCPVENLTFRFNIFPSLALFASSFTSSNCIQQHERALITSIVTSPLPAHQLPIQHLLDTLASLLLRPCQTTHLVHLFRPLLLDFAARWIAALKNAERAERMYAGICECCRPEKKPVVSTIASPHSSPKHDLDGNIVNSYVDRDRACERIETLLGALSMILPVAPQILTYAVQGMTMAMNLEVLQRSASLSPTSLQRQRRLMRSLYRLVRWDPSTFTPLMSWTPLYTIVLHHDSKVRTFAAHTLAIVLGMSDAETQVFVTRLLKADIEQDGELQLLRLIEDEYDTIEQAHLFDVSPDNASGQCLWIGASDLSSLTVDLSGILLPSASAPDNNRIPSLIPTSTTRRNLHSVALALSLNVPILLQGAPGVGKTSLVEEAARLLGRHDTLLKIHLGDQTDAKVLLGTYICTSTPGSFRWQPGVLTTAVTEGRWILFEDVDLAPLEVVSVLVPLLETGWLFVASRGEKVKAKEGFRVFGTRSVGPGTRGMGGHAAGEGLWHRVAVEPLSEQEIVDVISEKFPRLKAAGLQERIIKAFNVIGDLFKDKMVSGGRSASLRDLIKWCNRVEVMTKVRLSVSDHQQAMDVDGEDSDLSLAVREDLYREAADCFTGMITEKAVRDKVLEEIGSVLGVPPHRVHFYSEVHVPTIQTSDQTTSVGRVTLSKNPRDLLQASTPRPFAPTPSTVRLLERLAVSTAQNEPILLVGETGTGKTTVVQHLAHLTNTPLTVINMSQQSDSSDLLGGFKPVDVKILAVPVLNEFERLFAATFSVKANVAFLEGVRKGFKGSRWPIFIKGCRMGVKMAEEVFARMKGEMASGARAESGQANKKKKTKRTYDPALETEWQSFAKNLLTFESTQQKVSASLLFSFIEGALVRAIKEGHWVLLDEINLATPETLDCLTGLLASATSSLVLLERGDTEPVFRHPNFRLFGCMNPANDAGKKDLAAGLRGRFTEFWVDAPDSTFVDLVGIIRQYLQAVLPPSTAGADLCTDIATFYTSVRGFASQGLIYDGADHRVHYSMRTLARALMFAAGTTAKGVWGIRRATWEGCSMTFGTGLGEVSRVKVETVLRETVGKGVNLGRGIRNPDLHSEVARHVNVGSYWLPLGPSPPADTLALSETYILTPTVLQNLSYLSRAVMSGKYPVLIQGPTSAGKTSMVEYLAKLTGHVCVRVNNHEGTEVAEYIGGWGESEDGAEAGRGRLVWQEGILVTALKKGHWLILDELNLAPSDVLESLNRLLDDNRELFIPETQTTIRPHPSFMLFATQNPAGTTYGGRKQLSRAFRNRFLEIHFGDIPTKELNTILETRCKIAPSYAQRIVAVYKSLQTTRGRGRVFEGRHGFVTLRDLFRWAGRECVGYEALAEEGWCLLGERMRSEEDRRIVKEVIEKEMKVSIDIDDLYERGFAAVLAQVEGNRTGPVSELVDKMVWTPTTKRLFTLVWKCVQFNEPVLLVGDTGAGKTTVCQVVAAVCGKELKIVNAHQGSEVADFVGGMRPVRGREEAVNEAWETLGALRNQLSFEGSEHEDLKRAISETEDVVKERISVNEDIKTLLERARELFNKSQTLFTWRDGPLTTALRFGAHFLLDEISLADDSVLERLNSVLEPSQFLLLAEKGRAEALYAAEGFRFLATMNPGGDYGKKELSPALRNRFCEIWVPGVTARSDLEGLVAKKLNVGGVNNADAALCAQWMMDFYDWLAQRLRKDRDAVVSLRDVLGWIEFLAGVHTAGVLGLQEAFVHGGCMVVVDGIGVNPALGVLGAVDNVKMEVRRALWRMCGGEEQGNDEVGLGGAITVDNRFGVSPFFIAMGPETVRDVTFSFMAPTTLRNLTRVLRALQLVKPVLLEGSPGVGKTSLITTLAHLTGHRLTRINLSDQTDLMDLFGTDLPVEGTGNAGRFAWCDGPFLSAMKRGEWVLLDELNLASQQVLEGLNACLDHRGEVYIPELDRAFRKGAGFRVFAAQNPQGQGGGRKGLPRSFLNRFTSVYVDALTEADVLTIVGSVYKGVDQSVLHKMVRFNERMKEETMVNMRFGLRGAPWEFNLRDVGRWVELVKSHNGGDPSAFVEMMYAQRMRTPADREVVWSLFEETFGESFEKRRRRPVWRVTPKEVLIGSASVQRKSNRSGPNTHASVPIDHLHILPSTLPVLETLLKCVEMGYMPILTGPGGSGKTSLVRLLAGMCGVTLREFSLNPGVDAVELLGGFEQADVVRRRKALLEGVGRIVEGVVRELCCHGGDDLRTADQTMREWDAIRPTVDKGELDFLSRFVTDLERLAGRIEFDPLGRSLPTFDHIRTLINLYAEALVKGTHGTFEWIDGTIIRAMEEGHWILLDNVNLCPSSVLDRLNPLLESGGVLTVTERGVDANGHIRTVRVRDGFRIFMALDERFGEVSRAMRNRGVEVFVEAIADVEKASGLPGNAARAFEGGTMRKVRMCGRMIIERLQRGIAVNEAIGKAVDDVFDVEDADGVSGVVDRINDIINSEKRLLDKFSAPCLFPHFLSGRVVIEQSGLSRVAIDGSYLLYVLLSPLDMPNRANLLSAAAKIFMEGLDCREADVVLRRIWSGYVLRRFIRDDDTESRIIMEMVLNVLDGPDCETMEARRQVISDEVTGLPLDLRPIEGRIGEILRTQEGWPAYVRRMHLWDLRRRITVSQLIQERKGTGDQRGILDKSRLFANFRIGESELGHSSVGLFWPLMEAVRHAILRWIDCEADWVAENPEVVHAVLDQRDCLWRVLQHSELLFDEIIVASRRLRKTLDRCVRYSTGVDEDTHRVRALIGRVREEIERDGVDGSAILWRDGGITILKRQELVDVSKAFGDVNNALDVWRSNAVWGGLGHPGVVIDEDVRRAIVEGVSTLYYLNEGDYDNDLVQVLREVPIRLAKKVDSYVERLNNDLKAIEEGKTIEGASLVERNARVPMEVLEHVRERFVNVGLWALWDAAGLSREMPLLKRLGQFVGDGLNEAALNTLMADLQSHHTIMMSQTSRPPLDLEPFQRLIWVCDQSATPHALTSEQLNAFVDVIVQDAMYRWHRSLWANASAFWTEALEIDPRAGSVFDNAELDIVSGNVIPQAPDHKYAGPIVLERGIESRLLLRSLGDIGAVPVYGYVGKTHQVEGLLDYIMSTAKEDKSDIAKDDLGLLGSVILKFLENHRKAFDEVVHLEMMRTARDLADMSSGVNRTENVMDIVNEITVRLDDAKLDAVRRNLQKYLKPCLYAMGEAILSSGSSTGSRGRAWMFYSLAFLRAYLPEVPIDPAAGPAVKIKFMEEEASILRAEVHVRSEMERLMTGNEDNDMVHSLLERLKTCQLKSKKWAGRVALRPERSQMADIMNDLRQLGTHLLSDVAVESLLAELKANQRRDMTVAKEAHLQNTLSSLVERLETKYGAYRDILQPVYLAVYQFKYGLRLLTEQTRINEIADEDGVGRVLSLALRFIDDGKVDTAETMIPLLKRITSQKDEVNGMDLSSVGIKMIMSFVRRAQAVLRVRAGSRSDSLGHLHLLFGELVDAWSVAEQERLDKEQAEGDLYKYRERKHDLATEEEIEEAQFTERFPDFYGEFRDVFELPDGGKDPDQKPLGEKKHANDFRLDSKVAQEVRLLHKDVVMSWTATSHRGESFEEAWKSAFMQSYASASDLTRLSNLFPSRTLDKTGRAGHFFVATAQLETLTSTISKEDDDLAPNGMQISLKLAKSMLCF